MISEEFISANEAVIADAVSHLKTIEELLLKAKKNEDGWHTSFIQLEVKTADCILALDRQLKIMEPIHKEAVDQAGLTTAPILLTSEMEEEDFYIDLQYCNEWQPKLTADRKSVV